MTTRLDVVNEARSWVGTRWQHQATVKGVACDCRGLIVGVAIELGLPGGKEALQDKALRGYGQDPSSDAMMEGCVKYLDPIPLNRARLGDILITRFYSKRPKHFAIITNVAPYYIVHAFAQARQVVENGIDDAWRARIVGAYSYRGLT